mmetsp:Transcript_121/g.285  ORF Transcript_121/g.285 Transcript_121/m.285 type:complete len:262 (-) Transcript_121:157-942(-)
MISIEHQPRGHRRMITPPPPLPFRAPLSPMAPRTKSIGSIALVPSAGECSPTSVLVDVTASCPIGVSELKRIKGYSDQLLLPESMIYGNDLIKVWNIEDEQTTPSSNSFDDTTHQTMIRLQEEPTYNKNASVPLASRHEDRKRANDTPMFPMEEIDDILDDEDSIIDMDDLFTSLPPAEISLSPTMSSSPLSPPVSPVTGRDSFRSSTSSLSTRSSTRSSGSAKTLVLDDSKNEELLQPTKRPKGHRRHRRNASHFDFQFA